MDVDQSESQKDELYSDEEAYADENNGFKIQNPLEAPRTGTMTTKDLNCMFPAITDA
jgi:hypothetical protein